MAKTLTENISLILTNLELRETLEFQLQQHFRQTDLVCRYGGEEFLVILPDADLAYSQQRTESLRQTLGQLSLEDNGQQLGHLTASFGLASFPTYAQTSRELLQKADQALFLAKQQGRDRVIVYSSELVLESLTEP